MKQKNIGFKDLLEHLLPIHELPSVERLRIQRALRSDLAVEVERAAMTAIGMLEQQGAIKRLPPPMNPTGPVVRYQTRDQQDVITLHLPGPRQRDGISMLSKRALPMNSTARLDQVRSLVRLDDSLFLSNPNLGVARAGLREQLDEAGRELLGSGTVLFFSADENAPAPSERPLDPSLLEDALKHPDTIFYCPDTERSSTLVAPARQVGTRSLLLTAVTGTDGKPLGLIEVHHPDADPYLPSEMALVALLAESAGAVLQRAKVIEKKVFLDGPTQAHNREFYDLQIRKELDRAEREGTSLAVMLCDIDNFKAFNEAFGYEAGNQVLVKVASALKGGVREYDTVARWGGEEFVVLLAPHVREEDVITVSERLREAVEQSPIELEGIDKRFHTERVTISGGVAMFPDHARTPGDLFRLANVALKEAKRGTKNQIVIYQPPPPPGQANITLLR